MRSGDIGLAIEIPPGFGRDLARGDASCRSAPGSTAPCRPAPKRSRGYVQGMHAQWLAKSRPRGVPWRRRSGYAGLETRFRYNPDVESLVAMVPAVIPMLLMLIPAMLTALSVVREKELGSIINLYVTPTTRLEFLLGKQMPYVALAMLNFVLLTLLAVTAVRRAAEGQLRRPVPRRPWSMSAPPPPWGC